MVVELLPIGYSIDEEGDNRQMALRVFPNPTQGFLVIETDGSSLEYCRIFDHQGRLLTENLCPENKTSLDVSRLESGYYFLETRQGRRAFLKL